MNASTQAVQPIDEMAGEPPAQWYEAISVFRADRKGVATQKASAVRVVSLPRWELFRDQPRSYRVGIERFGAGAAGARNFEHYGFTVANVVDKALQLMESER